MKSLSIHNLEIKYNQNDNNEQIVCSRLSFKINQGEIIGIFGPNGSGKTSLLKTLLGLKTPSKGKVEFRKELAIKRSYIPQQIENSFFSWLSVRGNINYISKDKLSKERLNKLWDEFSLTYDFNINPLNCSGGMLQQAAIVRAFINKPDIIIGDEPFSALDVETAGHMRIVFRKKVKQLKAIAVLAMHNLDDLRAVCDKILFIPNKPYSSTEDEFLHQIKIYQNKYLLKEDFLDKETSLTSTVEKLFN